MYVLTEKWDFPMWGVSINLRAPKRQGACLVWIHFYKWTVGLYRS